MNRKNINTTLWMVILAAVTFCIGPIALAVIAYSHIVSDRSLERVLLAWRLLFIASPLIALFLGLRGSLPGTKPLAVTERSTNTVSKILILTVFFICSLFTLGAWVTFQPPPGRPTISIAFLGYTNGATGTRLARFAITNLNHSTIFAYNPNIEIQSPTEPRDVTNYWPGYNQWQQLHSMLAEGASTNFTIIPPTNQSPWRLLFLVYPDQGRSAKNIIRVVVGISCLSIGLMPRFERLPYDIESDWIEDEK